MQLNVFYINAFEKTADDECAPYMSREERFEQTFFVKSAISRFRTSGDHYRVRMHTNIHERGQDQGHPQGKKKGMSPFLELAAQLLKMQLEEVLL